MALVVGNNTYDHIGRLPNPENDAVDMAAALQRLGFDVTTSSMPIEWRLRRRCARFHAPSAGATSRWCSTPATASRMDGTNYVVPVDARLERDVDVRYETVTLDDLLVADGRSVVAARAAGRVPETTRSRARCSARRRRAR